MTASPQLRIELLEHELESLATRVSLLEKRAAPTRPAPAPETPLPAPAPLRHPEPATSPAASRLPLLPRVDLEELLGLRLLGLAGGLATLVGLAFLVALAVDRGWVGESARIGIALALSTTLLGLGFWLYERRGRTQASLALVGTAVTGLYLTLAGASVVYELVPLLLALPLALAVGAVATAIAVRWRSRTVAGLGTLGTLVAPAVADPLGGGGVGFLAVALAAAAAVLVWQRWEWLAVAAFAVSMPQVYLWALQGPAATELVSLLSVFAALSLAAALGYELRTRMKEPRAAACLLAASGATIVAAAGFAGLPHGQGDLAGGVWIAALAAAHGAVGIALLRIRRVSRATALLLVGLGLALADLAFGLLAGGAVLAVGWALSAAVLAGLARRYGGVSELVRLGLGAQLALAVAHTLLFDAPPTALAGASPAHGGGLAAVAAVAVCSFGCARLCLRESELWRQAADATTLAALAYLISLALDGTPLVVAYAAEAVVLAQAARWFADRTARAGALAFLGLAGAHALVYEAPPSALLHGPEAFVPAVVALGAVGAAVVRCARLEGELERGGRRTLEALAAGVALYLASVALVAPFAEAGGALTGQQGQALLSAFWGVCGFAALWLGLTRKLRRLRLAGFALLSLALGKVFLYDLAALDSGYRVGSCVAVGLLLLTAAYAYQRRRGDATSAAMPPRAPRRGRPPRSGSAPTSAG